MNAPPPTLLFPDAIGTLIYLAANSPPGAFVEVGVYKGGTAWYLNAIAQRQERALLLFDTFTGIPDKHIIDVQHNIGDFGDTSAAAVQAAIPEASFFIGRFPDTVLELVWQVDVAFVHVDCDQYQAVLDCIDFFYPKLAPNGVMLFDDFTHTSGGNQAVTERFSNVYQTKEGRAFVRKGDQNCLPRNAAIEYPADHASPAPVDVEGLMQDAGL